MSETRDGQGYYDTGDLCAGQVAEMSSERDAVYDKLCQATQEVRRLQAENKRFKDYLITLYEGDGNFEFDELEQALKGE